LRKLTPTLITLNFGYAFILGLRDNSKTIFTKTGQFNQAAAYIYQSYNYSKLRSADYFHRTNIYLSAKLSQISTKAHQDRQYN